MEEEILSLFEKEKLELEEFLKILRKLKDDKKKIKECLYFATEILEEKKEFKFLWELLKAINKEGFTFELEREKILKIFRYAFEKEEDLEKYLKIYTKELSRETFKYLELVEKLLNFKLNQRVILNDKLGQIENIIFDLKIYKVLMDKGNIISVPFLIAPEKIMPLFPKVEKKELNYFENPLELLKSIGGEKEEVLYEVFKIKAKEILKEKFDSWFENLGKKFGFLIYKKDKQYIKFFENFNGLLNFLKKFSEKERFLILEKNLKGLNIFEKDLTEFIKNYPKENLEISLICKKIEKKLGLSKKINYKDLLGIYSPKEIYKNISKFEEKKEFLDQVDVKSVLKELLFLEREFNLIKVLWERLRDYLVVEEVFSFPQNFPELFIFFMEKIREDKIIEDISREYITSLVIKTIEAYVNPSFSKMLGELNKLWEKEGSLPFLLNNLKKEELEEVVLYLESLKDYENFPYNALCSKIQMVYPEIFKKEGEEILCTKESFKKKNLELKKLVEEVPLLRKQIQEARELGDLRENFEYKAARQRYELLQAMILKIKKELTLARVVNEEEIDGSFVNFGTKVTLVDEKGKELILKILGPFESNPSENIYSYKTDLVKKILGKGLNSRIELFDKTYEIVKIEKIKEKIENSVNINNYKE